MNPKEPSQAGQTKMMSLWVSRASECNLGTIDNSDAFKARDCVQRWAEAA
jgi:hypothetical protein